jgi:flagellar basal body rod protein FlgG
MDVASNNLANIETPGFKVDVSMVRARDPERIEDGVMHLPSNVLLERLGGGVTPWPSRVDFKEGDLDITNNPLDVAIRGEGFFVVRDGSAPSDDQIRLTRDGRFLLDSSGRLVTHDEGRAVLDPNGRPITLDPNSEVEISGRGEIMQGDAVVGRLRIAMPSSTRSLIKDGDGLFRGPQGVMNSLKTVESPFVTAGAVERSGANPIMAVNDVRDAGGMVSRNARMIDIHNDAMQMAISRLGRVN